MKAIWIVVLGLLPVTVLGNQRSIPMMYQLVAKENRVPEKLFYALILNESRSRSSVRESSRVLPWPWTINHRGKAFFFPNREAAYHYARTLVNRGDRQFDVGLGQLNWYWQEQRFKGLWDAFDPYTNLSAAAHHLREQYERPECNNWELAVGCYHRPGQRDVDKEIAKQYRQRVFRLWEQI